MVRVCQGVCNLELLITFLAGMSMAVGALFVKCVKDPHILSQLSTSLALGALAALVVFDLGPEAVEYALNENLIMALVALFVGFGLLSLLETLIPNHDHAEDHDAHATEDEIAVHIGLISVVALMVHNVVEGMTMYALALESLQQGAIYAFGVALHNIPMGMLIFTALRSERRRIKALALAGALLSTVLGGLIMMAMSGSISPDSMELLGCAALGMVLYIALEELVPHTLYMQPRWVSVLGTLAGFALVVVASMLE
jgi:ZIP family zinc transporter